MPHPVHPDTGVVITFCKFVQENFEYKMAIGIESFLLFTKRTMAATPPLEPVTGIQWGSKFSVDNIKQ